MILPEVLPGVEGVAADFYTSSSGLVLPQYVRPAMSARGDASIQFSQTPTLHVPEWVRNEDALKDFFGKVGRNLDAINTNLQVVQNGGDSFEVSIVKSTSETKKGVMLHISTYSSSLSTNLGNAYEFAVQSALYEDFDHVYVASPGNGGSSNIENTDVMIDTPAGKMGQKDYFKATGRTTYEDSNTLQPLPYLVNMQRALDSLGIETTGFIGTDSAGGSYATGLAVGLPEDQISHGFFSERSNFTAISKPALIFGMLFTENMRHANKMKTLLNESQTPIDPLSLFSPRLDDPEKLNESLAHEKMSRTKDILKNHFRRKIGALATSLTALGRGSNSEMSQNPLVDDVNGLLARHPRGHFTFTLAEHDVLYSNKAAGLAQSFLADIDIQQADVKTILLSHLPHAYHTSLPLLQDAVRRVAFDLAA